MVPVLPPDLEPTTSTGHNSHTSEPLNTNEGSKHIYRMSPTHWARPNRQTVDLTLPRGHMSIDLNALLTPLIKPWACVGHHQVMGVLKGLPLVFLLHAYPGIHPGLGLLGALGTCSSSFSRLTSCSLGLVISCRGWASTSGRFGLPTPEKV